MVKGFQSFIMSNLLLVFAAVVFVINHGSKTPIFIFIFFAEIFIVLLSFIACFNRQNHHAISGNKSSFSNKEWIGLLLTIIKTSLLSLGFTGIGIKFPSTIVILILVINFMFALYSILFHTIALKLYKANVYDEKSGVLDFTFKYIAILFSGINFYVQTKLLNLPLVVNKIFAIVFVLFLLWQSILVISVFE
ncbi:hypothetical protein [Lentibacillus songyuanensis]|uniref:hypothetical protein n=1 Tax=Lentibacillus songyuanensis TaxID=3136161 RepID=UPI0031BACF68